MCTRITLIIPLKDIEIRFGVDEVYFASENPGYNIAPTHRIATVIKEDDKTKLMGMRWGLIPSWSKDMTIGSKLINARSETLFEKPIFKSVYSKRCLILADGFYEWKKKGKERIPIYFHLKEKNPNNTNKVFALAGLYDLWSSPNGDNVHSCSVITTEANKIVGEVHNRMPVILNSIDSERSWINSKLDIPNLKNLLIPYPTEKMTSYKVSKFVNSPKNNTPKCTKPDMTKSILDFV